MGVVKIIVLGIVLIIMTIFDIREGKLPAMALAVSAILSLLTMVLFYRSDIKSGIFGMIVGIFIYIFARLSKVIGEGDGLLLMITGLLLGIIGNIELIFVAVFIAALVSIVLIAVFKFDKKRKMPFVPYLMVSYVAIVFMNYVY